jgi:hypothetical protein
MNIRILVTAAIAALSIAAYSQRPPARGNTTPPPSLGGGAKQGGGMRRGGIPEELKKQLALTPAQEKKIEAIRAKYAPKFKALGFTRPAPGQKPDPNAKKPDMTKARALFDAQRKEVEAVYTPKQKAILKKYMEAHPRRGMGGPGGMRRPGGPGKPGGPGAKGTTGHGG